MDSGTSYYYELDHLGSVVSTTNSSGTTEATLGTDGYGFTLSSSGTEPTFGYAGMFLHQPSGLYLTENRAYDPYSGRWLSRDPAGEGAGVNLYGNVEQDPINENDPLGLYTLQLGVAGGGTIFGFAVPQGGFGIAIGGFGIAIDTHGNVGTYAYSGIGVGAGVEAGYGGSVQVSDAHTIYDLNGPFSNTSLHGGAGAGGSVDVFTGSSSDGEVIGGGVTFGASEGAAASLTTTSTQVCGSQGCVGSPLPLVNVATPASAASESSPPNVSPTGTSTGQSPCN